MIVVVDGFKDEVTVYDDNTTYAKDADGKTDYSSDRSYTEYVEAFNGKARDALLFCSGRYITNVWSVAQFWAEQTKQDAKRERIEAQAVEQPTE